MLDTTFTFFGNCDGREVFVVVKDSPALNYLINEPYTTVWSSKNQTGLKSNIIWDRVEPIDALDNTLDIPPSLPYWKAAEWRKAEFAFWGIYNGEKVVICPTDLNKFINSPSDTTIEVVGELSFLIVNKGSIEWDNIELLTPVD